MALGWAPEGRQIVSYEIALADLNKVIPQAKSFDLPYFINRRADLAEKVCRRLNIELYRQKAIAD